jgi:tRNA (cmo5U34)-methyltransferase
MENKPGQYHFDPDTYMEMVLAEVPAYEELQDRTAQSTVGVKARRILDLGVGMGETAHRVLAEHPDAHLVGIDENPEMLARAARRLADADLRVARLEDPLPDGEFDLVVSALSVHHLDGAAKADLFRRIRESLRLGGRFVLADVVIPDDPNDVVTPVDGVHDKPSRVDEQLAWLQEAHFHAHVAWIKKDLAIIVADRV